MKDYPAKDYYSRLKEVENINSHAYDKSNSAMRRDKWLYDPIIKNIDLPKLTEEQIKEVEEFWKPYEFAYKNDYHQQEMYTGISGKFDPSYFGFGMQRHLMVRFWNHDSFKWIGEKNFTPLYFSDANMPQTLIYKSCGIFFDSERNPVNYTKAIDLLMAKLKNTPYGGIIKPSGGGEGSNISFLEKDFSREQVEKTVKEYKSDFICQQVIKNHSSFAAPYSGSLNTMRIYTLFWKEKIYCTGAVMRMGTNKRVDNWSQGGLAIGIEPDGRLQKYAFTELGELTDTHPTTGFVFKDHVLYRFNDAVELAKKLHGHIAQQKFISWDITVDENGELFLIELNSPGSHELLEMSGQNAYVNRDVAKEIFDKYLIESFFYEKAVFDWNYREFNDHISLRAYKGLDTHITVPKEIDGKPVRIIYSNAVMQKNIQEIRIPASVHYTAASFPNIASTCEIKIIVDDE